MRISRLVPLLVLACTPAAVTPAPNGAPVAAAPDIDTLIARLSVKQKVAQLVMPFLPGSYAAADD